MTSTLSAQLKPELDGVSSQVRYYQREVGPTAVPHFLTDQLSRVLQRIADAVGLDVVRDAETIFTGDYVLRRAQVNPISLQVVYTQDGQSVQDPLTWHTGDHADEPIYYERYNLSTGARLAHGYIDRVSRQLVQSG